MKAMILAAGHGTRVRPLTYEMPKPMIPILGKPVMEYLIETLAQNGFKEIMINVSYLPEQIERYFGDGRRWGVEIGYSFEGKLVSGIIHSEALGSAGGLKKIQNFSGFFDDTFLVACGDSIIDVDLSKAIQIHKKTGAMASVLVKHVPKSEVENYGIVVTDENSKITSFQEKPNRSEAKSTLANTGVYILEPEVLSMVPSSVHYDIGSQLFPDLVSRKVPFYAIELPFKWIDLGKVSDFWEIHQRVLQGEVPWINIPGKEIKNGICVGLNVNIDWENVNIYPPVYIGSSTKIEKNCTIVGPTWISHGCHIQENVNISRSILFPYTTVLPSSKLDELVICGGYYTDKLGGLIHSIEDDSRLSG